MNQSQTRHGNSHLTTTTSMIPVVFSGCWDDASERILTVFQRGYDVHIEHRSPARMTDSRPRIVGMALDEQTPFEALQRSSHQGLLAWFAWNRSDSPQLALRAYQAGAQSVLPSVFTSDILFSTIDRLRGTLERKPDYHASHGTSEKRYDRGQVIFPEQHSVLDVISGVISVTVIHDDGAEVLLGLCGPGQTLVGHPEDSCRIRLVAHTRATARIRSWDDAMNDVDLPLRMRARLQQMEAWAAMQARPHLEQRIMGLLSLLAEQFGRLEQQGMIIDVRITHQHLASAVGATRTTITRILRDLKRSGALKTIEDGNPGRFCLLNWEPHSH